MIKTKSRKESLLSVFVVISFFLLFFSHLPIKDAWAAGTVPVPKQVSPANGASFKASSSGVYPISFTTFVTDPDSLNNIRTNVVYRKVGEANWHVFGTTSGKGPNGAPAVANGITTKYLNKYGWTCSMGWGNSGPANCDSPYNGRIPAFHSTNIYFPSVKLTAGTYEWSVRAYDGTNYSGFITPIRFTVKAYVAPPPPPPPPCTTCGPGPDPEPDPDPNAGPVDGGGYIDSGDITSTVEEIADDKEAPSIPGNLQGEFSPDDNTIHLTWDASTDNTQLNGYEVERTEKGTEKWEAIGNVSTEEFDDFEFEPQKTYQYRVRAVDAQENKSAYSNVVDIIAGEFFPNVKAKEGGTVNIDNVILEFPNGSVDEDLFVTAEKVQKPKIKFGDNTKLVGDVWEVKAKNEKGDSVTQFKTQITLRIKYTKNQISGVTESTIKLANFSDDKIKVLSTKLDRKAREAKTLTDHFSIYLLVANKTGAWATFLKIILWIMLLGAIGFGIYYLYVLYQRREYQKVHQDDYIYRS